MRIEFKITGWRKSIIKFIRHKCKVKNCLMKHQKERFRLANVYESKGSDRMKWIISGGCGVTIIGFFRNIHKGQQRYNWSAYRGLSRPTFLFCDSYFVLMWHKSSNTRTCKYCNKNWLCHCQGPCCLSRARLVISVLWSLQKEYRHMRNHFLGISCS